MGQEFGGDWTEQKLSRLKNYLEAYTKIFRSNEAASHFAITYLDAFAGSGYRKPRSPKAAPPPVSLFGIPPPQAVSLRKGSALLALETHPSFDRYIFIDRDEENVAALSEMLKQFPDKVSKTQIHCTDANTYIQKWCAATDWRKNRAVVFIDPFGMQVEWKTLAAIGDTEAIDLWLLFPLGQGVNRLLTRSKPPKGWEDRLTIMFGTDSWKDAFYAKYVTNDLFQNEVEVNHKIANWNSIEGYFVERLKTIFHGVSQKPLALMNSKNVPIFLLCFAAGNPKGAKTALKIADYLLK